MSKEIQFKRLIPAQIKGLFDAYAQTLRLTYIEILALLQDILGRYSSKGNPTVFLNSSDAENHIYEALKRIRAFELSNEVVFQQAGHLRRVQVLIETATTSETWERLRRKNVGLRKTSQPERHQFRTTILKNLRPNNPELQQLLKEFEVTKEDKKRISVTVLVNDRMGVLNINGQIYKINRFTLAKFRGAFRLTNRLDNSQQAYNTLMREVRHPKTNLRERSQRKFVKDLQEAVLYSASQNVAASLELKSQSVQEQKRLALNLQKNIDHFLTDLLDEYQLLRKVSPHRFSPPLANKQKTSTRTKNPQARSDILI